jgi:hypothetical protein
LGSFRKIATRHSGGNIKLRDKLGERRFNWVYPSAIYVVLTMLNIWTDWPLLRSTGLHASGFIDLKSVLDSANNYKTLGDRIFEFNPDVPGSGYMYGSFLLRTLNFLQLNPTLNIFIGYVFIGLTIIMISIVVSGCQFKNKVIQTAFYVAVYAPFIWLLQERGNLDILIFFLLFIACFMLSKNYVMTFYLLVILTALLKFYTLPLIIIPWLYKFRVQRFRKPKIGLLVLLLSYSCLQIFIDLKRSPSFPAGAAAFFGTLNYASWLDYFSAHFQLGIQVNSRLVQGVFVLITLLAGYMMAKSNIFGAYSEAQAKLSQEGKSNFSTILCASFSLLFLSCFLAGSNYDYRLLTLSVAGIIFLQYAKLSNFMNFIFYGLLMVAFWFSILAISNAYLQFIGDLAVNCWASISFGLLLQVYKKRNQII